MLFRSLPDKSLRSQHWQGLVVTPPTLLSSSSPVTRRRKAGGVQGPAWVKLDAPPPWDPQPCLLRPTSCTSWCPSPPALTHIPGVDIHVHKLPHVLFPHGIPLHPCSSLTKAWTSHVLGRKEAEEEVSLSYLPPGDPDAGLRGCWALESRHFQRWDEPATAR